MDCSASQQDRPYNHEADEDKLGKSILRELEPAVKERESAERKPGGLDPVAWYLAHQSGDNAAQVDSRMPV